MSRRQPGSILLVLAGFLLISASGEVLNAHQIITKRVAFERGANSSTVEGSIYGRETVDYLLNVQSGQYMNVSLASGNAGVYCNVMEPGEQYDAIYNGSVNGNQFEGTTSK